MPDPILLETSNLTKIYGDVQPVYALKGISLRVKQGEFLSIIGERAGNAAMEEVFNIFGPEVAYK
ncbi:MAG: hypothetical protein K0Q50_2838, partial [Vampirovibrio sp.]|nr:hypothetical protein [Vampirovibrio sp.]